MNAEVAVLTTVLDRWKEAVDAHDPERVAENFTEDAIFQGLHPYTVGPKGVAEYYDSQPIGMTATYTIQETRRLSDNLVLGYLHVDFDFTDRPTVSVQLSLLVEGEKIRHYQVSRL
ncbi:nuclear transport factor 2 family protein [Kutzneria sp. CA-103260]|uniref:nuclear transport factor 2 family protein n=1 Tax=Kutzneria sp. CA-103260 TaxID=2802641 RepID=UPI001BA7D499|nr:nuclear transport factor 2 family protein [Kutzneria sp. CA-103260]QUQ66945.1 SDR family oxidoreductase [Kutzneria sp. CA-103260]